MNQSNAGFPSAEIVSLQSASVRPSSQDAGSTPATAYDLGQLSSRQLNGSLLIGDSVDLFKFDVTAESRLRANLNDLGGNVDLLLADDQGQVVARSTNRVQQDKLSVTLDSGEYYLAAFKPQYFDAAFYRLNVDLQGLPRRPETPDRDASDLDPLPKPIENSAPDERPPNDRVTVDDVQPFPDVPYLGSSSQVHLNAVKAPEAFAQGLTGEGVVVAIVDTGVDLDHPELAGNLFVNPGEIAGNGLDDDANGFVDDVHGYDFVDRDADPNDTQGHGTHVAGIVAAADNGTGTIGVAYDAEILPVRVLGNNGSGSTSNVAAGIRYAADLGADIINLSLGGGYSQTIRQAIEYAGQLGSMVIAAAGNEGTNTPSFPASFSGVYEHVLSVGAITENAVAAGFANQVGNSQAVQIDAPGVNVISTYPGGRFARMSGTSQAAPHVAGVAALALQARPELTAAELRSLLIEGADVQALDSDAIGIVNAATSVAFAAAGVRVGTSSDGGTQLSENSHVTSRSATSRATSIAAPPALEATTHPNHSAFRLAQAYKIVRKSSLILSFKEADAATPGKDPLAGETAADLAIVDLQAETLLAIDLFGIP